MAGLLKRLKRFWLRQRIDWLRADIAVAIERRELASITFLSTDEYLGGAQSRLLSLEGQLAVIERPETLLAEALHGGDRIP